MKVTLELGSKKIVVEIPATLVLMTLTLVAGVPLS